MASGAPNVEDGSRFFVSLDLRCRECEDGVALGGEKLFEAFVAGDVTLFKLSGEIDFVGRRLEEDHLAVAAAYEPLIVSFHGYRSLSQSSA
jgi:hypothetical protein